MNGIFDGPIPAAVVAATSTEEVPRSSASRTSTGSTSSPAPGITSTEGGLETIVEDTIVLDGSPMNRIVHIDALNMMATAQCGVPLEVLEDAVRLQGLTTGHSPQSKPLPRWAA